MLCWMCSLLSILKYKATPIKITNVSLNLPYISMHTLDSRSLTAFRASGRVCFFSSSPRSTHKYQLVGTACKSSNAFALLFVVRWPGVDNASSDW